MYLVSACLGGMNCRYDGKSLDNEEIRKLISQGKAVLVCPEQLGGLSTPRTPCELCQGRVVNQKGEDKTAEFCTGAQRTLAIAKALGIKEAILKTRSPSCGCGMIYDGTFSGKVIQGNGLTADLLMKNGIKVYTEKEIKRNE